MLRRRIQGVSLLAVVAVTAFGCGRIAQAETDPPPPVASEVLTPRSVLADKGLVGGPATASLPGHDRAKRAAAQIVLDWQRIALRTVFTETATPIPSASLYLGFTSLAVDDAVRTASGSGKASGEHGRASAVAAAAQAAHDVLAEYFPTAKAKLDADLATSLAAVPSGKAKASGIRVGQRAARDMIASRVGDGRGAAITYSKNPAPGVWQPPPPPGGMLLPWLGFVDPLVLRRSVRVDGPDPITSAAYAADFNEVKRIGSLVATDRSAHDTETARFFNFNAILQLHEALIRHLEESPLSLPRTARLFAAIDAATADALIQGWRLKYDYGYWRPFQAIPAADTDGNPATAADTNWAPLLTAPPYPDYVSGHALITGAFAGSVREFLGDDVPLLLRSTPPLAERRYSKLSAIEDDAFMARIWLGFHFRDAMDDGYQVAHTTARHVARQLG